ncbi:hypothetical protein ABH994_002153 [Bradyrhizobium yuanmingense]|uniref:Transposase n=1 Tax=Bradyrhizobium yuanmingense TaxID=108015 RepID=A0ABV4GC48_9BRAD
MIARLFKLQTLPYSEHTGDTATLYLRYWI